MPLITALKPGRRRKRLNIHADGEFLAAVSEQVAALLGLKVGMEVDPDRLREILTAEETHRATEAALRLLDIRARSESEIRARLAEKGYEEATVETAVAKLKSLELLDDSQFAAQWVEMRTQASSPDRLGGKRLIETELVRKGIAKDLVETAVAGMSEEEEIALSRKIVAKKARPLPTDPEALLAERQRLTGFLARRGFRWEVVRKVVNEALKGGGDDDDSEE